MRDAGEGVILDQFANPDNPLAHYDGHRARDLARHARDDHALRRDHGHDRHHHGLLALPQGEESRDPGDRRASPSEGSQVPGIRKWPEAYLPKIYDARASTA